MTEYPGDDPDDPFAKPPKQDGAGQHVGDETAPISGAGQQPPPPPPPQPGYWEQQAQAQPGQPQPGQPQPGQPQPGQAQPEQTANPWAGYGQPAGAAPPPPPPTTDPTAAYPQPYYGGQPAYLAPPNHPNAVTALVLGIISIACCQIAGPFAWYVGGKARREIRASNGQLGGDGQATAGWIMGIVATVLIGIVVVLIVFAVVLGLASSGTGSSFDA